MGILLGMNPNKRIIPDRLVEPLFDALAKRGADQSRYLLGITGCPGSGKSTFADRLVETVNQRLECAAAAVIPMDGFHFRNAVLEARGLRLVKGSPATFDVPGFIDLLRKLRASPPVDVPIPLYDRTRHEPVADATTIGAKVKLIVVEGNYLLLDTAPWDAVRPLLDAVWFLDMPVELAMARVRKRHIAGGSDEKLADEKIAANDQPNAELVIATRSRADRVLRP